MENEILILPSERTLRRITYKFGSPTQNTSVNYLKARRAGLTSSQSYINLMLDEIYTAKRIEYSSASGKVMGLTQAGEVASTILCFMASSVCDKYQDAVALIPISHLNADKLKEATWNVLQLLAESGFNVVSLCCDNHTANRSFFKNVFCGGVLSSMVYDPITKRSLFLLFDSVHNLKNIYNNFCKRRILSFPSIDDPISIKTASFIDIRNLYAEESNRPLKLAHKLTQKSLAPKNIEKTSVKLSNAIFHESTLHALQYFNENQGEQWTGTADFVEIVLKMWKIVNVKTPSIGQHKKDMFREPISSCDDFKLHYLEKFAQFIETWYCSGLPCLSKETCLAVKHTSLALCDIAKYLLSDLGFSYVLLGKFQSDVLESRFGWYRQMCGGNYFISVQQVLQNERKIKAISLIKFSGFSLRDDFDDSSPPPNGFVEDVELFLEQISQSPRPSSSELNSIYYVTGPMVRSQLRAKSCDSCSDILLSSSTDVVLINPDVFDEQCDEACKFMNEINRGGFIPPNDISFSLCQQCYCIFNAIRIDPLLEQKFLAIEEKKHFFVCLVSTSLVDIWSNYTTLLKCSVGHDIIKSMICKFFNCFMSNYVVVVVYPTPSEGWGHGGRPWSPRSRATPQGLDQRS